MARIIKFAGVQRVRKALAKLPERVEAELKKALEREIRRMVAR